MSGSPPRLLSIAASVVMVAAVLSLYVSGSLFSPSPLVIVCQIATFLFSMWARFTLGLRSFHFPANPTAEALVTTGPYRFVRNPIYTAVWLFAWAGVAAHPSPTAAGLGLLVFLTLVVRALCEERLLRERFAEYPAYARRTARLIPFVF